MRDKWLICNVKLSNMEPMFATRSKLDEKTNLYQSKWGLDPTYIELPMLAEARRTEWNHPSRVQFWTLHILSFRHRKKLRTSAHGGSLQRTGRNRLVFYQYRPVRTGPATDQLYRLDRFFKHCMEQVLSTPN